MTGGFQRLLTRPEQGQQLLLQGTAQALGAGELPTRDALGQAFYDFDGGINADIRQQQLRFQLLQQVCINFLAAQEQRAKAGHQIVAGAPETTTQA